ncbi:hypothetical protein H5410_055882 [Solanum commersonii]|uniref:DUF4283 domain-containing protein n=1 Tax=Solanum commersonii TaxID=4109 RepID=A0A9J5WKP1_SOLCO|nr:hypothetical protein H5410_055882 [Solanum commersonii]
MANFLMRMLFLWPQIKPPEIYKGKSAAFFTPQEEEESAKDCRFTIVGKFSHGKPAIDHIRRDFATRFPLKGYLMRMVTWTLDFNPEEEKSLAPIWITLPSLKWHYFNWDALLQITSTIVTLLKIDKATNAKTRPNSAKVIIELDLAVQRRKSIWVGIKEEDGKEIGGFWQEIEYDFTFGINATQNIASSFNNRNGEFNYHKEGDKVIHGDIATVGNLKQKNMTGVNHSKHAEILLTKDVVLSTTAGKSKQKQVDQFDKNLKQHETQQKIFYHKNFKHTNFLNRQRIQQGIKAKLNKKNVTKWVARPPKDNNLQQKLSQAKDVIHDFLRSSNVIDVDTGITDGGKELELEVGKVQFEVHLPAVKPITISNSFKHLEEFDKDREVCYSEGMKKASSAANIASSSNTFSTTNINTRQTVTLKDDAEIYAQDKLTKPDKDSSNKLQAKSPYVLDNYRPILSGKPPKNVHNEVQGINLEVQLLSPNSLVDVTLQVITPTAENSTGNHANNEDNIEDEKDEHDPDYGVEQERNTEEGSDEEFEECDSSDEDALINAFAPKTSWKGERQSLINNGNLSPSSVSRNANVNHKDFAKPGVKSRGAFERLKLLSKIHNTQIIAIQEPFVDACHIDKYRKGLGFEGCSSNCNGKIWVLWSNDVHIDVAKDNEQQLTLKVTNKSNTKIVWFTVVYAKSKQHLRLPLWDSLRTGNKQKIWKRLDIKFINQHWIDNFSIIDIEHLASTGSDRTPMIVKYSTSEHPKIRIDQPNFKDVVQEAWNEDVDGNSMRRLHLKMKNHIGNVFDKVRVWEAKMLDLATDYIENDNDDLRPQIHKTQAEHTRWLKWDEQIAKEVVDYFSKLFSDDQEIELHHFDCIDQGVHRDDNNMLESIPNEAEIKEVVFGLNFDSTPELDGFGGAFYQSC